MTDYFSSNAIDNNHQNNRKKFKDNNTRDINTSTVVKHNNQNKNKNKKTCI